MTKIPSKIATLPIDGIAVGKRHRRDMGDVNGLAASIGEVGLLQPVVVTPDNRLVAGARRLKAAKLLGWEEVPVHVVANLSEAAALLKAERDENTCRKDFAPLEALSLGEALEKYFGAQAKERKLSGKSEDKQAGGRGKKKPSGKFPEGLPQTRDQVGSALGMSGKTYEKVKAVARAAKESPEEYADLAKQMNETGKVDRAHKEMQRRQQRAENAKIAQDSPSCTVKDLERLIARGKIFGTIYADPPWQYDNRGTRSAAHDVYKVDELTGRPTLAFDELAALPVRELAAEKSHLHLWTTNGFIVEALNLIECWGFTYKSMFVWVKPQLGIGNYWRVSHEIMLLGVRGGLTFFDASLKSWIEAERTEHSSKPEVVRQFIERASPGPWLEMFGRRPAGGGWVVWGNDIKQSMFDKDVIDMDKEPVGPAKAKSGSGMFA